MIATGFIRPAHERILTVADTLDGLLAAMADNHPPRSIFAMETDEL